MTGREIQSFHKKILHWYRANARNLPWRQTRDPYKIWVSEIMLQQTQVQTVIAYYERWLSRFPGIEALAKAPISAVLKHWAGLGYYRRARMLHQGAKLVSKKYAGNMPQRAEELQKIPGIGRYTAGAIASIAYGTRVPALDGNVIRILTRIYGIEDDIGRPKTIQRLWKLAEKLVGATFPAPGPNIQQDACRTRRIFRRELRPFNKNNFHAGDFNQALMELGATVCFPKNPQCERCPVASLCKARKLGLPERFPIKKNKEMTKNLKTAALIFRKNGKVLLLKQPLQGRWGGLWAFPHWKNKKSMMSELQCAHSDLKHRITVKHGFTKYRIELEVFELAGGREQGAGGNRASLLHAPCPLLPAKWVRLSELQKFAFPSPHQKIVADILTHV